MAKPLVFILCIEEYCLQLSFEIHRHLLCTLETKAEVRQALKPAQARRYLTSTVAGQRQRGHVDGRDPVKLTLGFHQGFKLGATDQRQPLLPPPTTNLRPFQWRPHFALLVKGMSYCLVSLSE